MSRSRPHRLTIPLVLLAVVGALLSGLVAAGPAVAADPLIGAPPVGTCQNYTYRQRERWSDATAPVPCDGPHTALVAGIIPVPKRVKMADGDAVITATQRGCDKSINAAIGGTSTYRSLTAFSGSVFLPTRAQVAQGARWVRCDVVLKSKRTLVPLPTPLLTDPLTDAIAKCINKKNLYVVCAEPHESRAVRAVKLRGAYPKSDQRQRQLGVHACGALAKYGQYTFIFPSKLAWNVGAKFVTCFLKTRK